MLTKAIVATAACLSLSTLGAIALPEPAEFDSHYYIEPEEETTSLDSKLHQFADELRENLGIEEGEIDDRTENLLLRNKLFFLLFGLLFCWIAVRSLGSKH